MNYDVNTDYGKTKQKLDKEPQKLELKEGS